ncbi:hypothetical protein LCGC14_1837230 [marine sediment metagenome]|uniref:Uncharacterized protein n=1 Tax=marine sediment metagenome TaxID=412755 RepID=A0A0F9GEA1_9ZZZZ
MVIDIQRPRFSFEDAYMAAVRDAMFSPMPECAAKLKAIDAELDRLVREMMETSDA